MADRRREVIWLRRLGIAVMASVLLLAWALARPPDEPAAHLNISKYTYSECSRGKARSFIDPIGIVFYGRAPTRSA